LALSQEGAPGTKNYPSDRQGNWHFAEVSGPHHTQRHSVKKPEETILAWSGIQHSITDQAINQWPPAPGDYYPDPDRDNVRVKAKMQHTLNICCDVFV